LKNFLKLLAFLLIAVGLMWLSFRSIDFSKLYAQLKVANYSWLLLSMFFGLVAYISRVRRWMLLINPLGYKPTFLNSFNALMAGYLANLALPRIGEITRCVALGKKEKIPVDQLIGTVIIERAIDVISLLLIMIALIFTGGGEIRNFISESIIIPVEQNVAAVFGTAWVLWVSLMLIVTAALILMIIYRRRLIKIRLFAKLFSALRGIVNGLKAITNLKRKGEFIFHTVFIWVSYFFMTWLVVFSLEATSHLTVGNGIFLLVIGGLAMAAPVQGGFGAFHYIVSRGLLIFGIPLEDGLAYAILTHESQLLLVVITGIIAFFLIFRNKKERRNG
jgi:uncharacterized protein (TIRG00374 family)